MLWTSPGSPGAPHGLNPVEYRPAGKAAGIVCGWDRGIFGPQGLSGQSPSAGVSATASDRQRGRLIGDKVLQKKIITRGCLRPGQSRRSEDTVWLRFSSGTCWNTPSHAALAERGPCARAWGQERQSWSHCHWWGKRGCCGSAQGHGGLAAEHACRCAAKSSMFLQKHGPEILNSLLLPLSCAQLLHPGGGRSSRAFHQPQQAPGFHLPALLRTSQAGGTPTLERERTLCSHLPVSFNLCEVFSLVGRRLNIKPLKKNPVPQKNSEKAGQELACKDGDESVPLSCVQGNTDPAPASRFWLHKGWITAEVMRHNSGQRLLLGACLCRFTGQEPALPFSFGQPRTLFFANSSFGQPGSRGRHPLEVALTQGTGSSQHLLPPAKGAAHLPSQIRARNSLQDASPS